MKKHLLLFLTIVFLLTGMEVLAATVSGYAWSENIGWINFRNNAVPYGVDIDEATGIFSGYAWSENIGWVGFNDTDLVGCPSAPCEAKLDLISGDVSGWAKPLFSRVYEYFSSTSTSRDIVWGPWLKGQTFTVGNVGKNERFNVISAKIKAFREGSPGNVIASIRNVDGGGLPIGGDLCSGNINGDDFTDSSPGEWYEIPIRGMNCVLNPGQQYALIINGDEGSSGNEISWMRDAGGTYAGGNGVNLNTIVGPPWSTDALSDYQFEILGSPMDNWMSLSGANYKVYLEGSEFKGWAWGGGQANDEAMVGWTSFNAENTGSIFDYNVTTSLVLNNPPVAKINAADCNPADCRAYSGDFITLENNSTDLDGLNDIVLSEWFTKPAGVGPYNPGPSFAPPNVFNDYPINTAFFAQGNWYTAMLRVTDNGGLSDEATQDFYVIRDIVASFECSLDQVVWDDCPNLRPIEDDVIHLRDTSIASEGEAIDSWTWSLGGVVFDSGSNTTSLSAVFPTMTLRLEVEDTKAPVPRSDSAQEIILGIMPLPTWWEIPPF